MISLGTAVLYANLKAVVIGVSQGTQESGYAGYPLGCFCIFMSRAPMRSVSTEQLRFREARKE